MRLFSDMGFDAVFMGRVDRHDKEKRRQNKELEFVWRPANNSLGKNT